MRRAVIAIAAAVTLASGAPAATLDIDLGLQEGPVDIPQFDPSLGTLQAVTVNFTYFEQVAVTTNLTTPTAVTYTASGFYSTYIAPFYFDGTVTGMGSTTIGRGPVVITLTGSVTETRTDPAFLAFLTGTGTVFAAPAIDPPSVTFSTGVATASELISQLTGYQISYTYDDGGAGPGAVPEPASWAAMIAGLGLIGAAQRRARRRPAAFA